MDKIRPDAAGSARLRERNKQDFRNVVPMLPGLFAALLLFALLLRGTLGWLGVLLALTGFSVSMAMQPNVRRRAEALFHARWLPEALLVCGVIVLAAGLRFVGLRFGLPYLDHPDEWATADPALRMLKTGDYQPDSFIYPSLTTYLQLGVAVVHFLSGVSAGLYTTVNDVVPAQFYAWGRALTALLGTMSVALTYVIGRRLYGVAAGAIAALLVAVYPLVSGDAHYITTDTPALFFSLLAFLAVVWLAEAQASELAWGALLAGFAVGLAFSTKYNVAVLVAPLVVALMFHLHRPASAIRGGICAMVGIAVGFTLGTPFWLVRLPQLLNDLASIVIHYKFTGHSGAETELPALFYWDVAVSNGVLLAFAFLASLVVACVRHRRADLLVLAFVVPSLLQLASVPVVFARNAVPVIPFLCMLVGACAASGANMLNTWRSPSHVTQARTSFKLPISTLALVGITLLLATQPLAIAARDEWLRAQPTTRLLATEWVETHVPSGALLWMENNTLTLPDRFRVRGGEPVTVHPPEWYREHGYSYLVVDRDARVRKEDAVQLAAFGEPVVDFDSAGQRHGPMYSIYAVGGSATSDPRTPSGATLGSGALTLDGFRHSGEVQPGAVLPLALYWKVNRSLPLDYIVFVHLLDAEGNKVAQRDTPPLDGARPTSSWQSGELIRDDADLAIPDTVPDGVYTLVAGMYDPQTVVGINDSGPIVLGQVRVARP